MAVESSLVKKDAQELHRLARTALEKAGANSKMAEAAARHLVRAEEQGLPTHGMSRVPFYCGMLRKGRADGAAQPAMIADRAATCLIDNRDGLPYVSAQWAVEEAIQRARRNGRRGRYGGLRVYELARGYSGVGGQEGAVWHEPDSGCFPEEGETADRH
jgi:hypothetical protein